MEYLMSIDFIWASTLIFLIWEIIKPFNKYWMILTFKDIEDLKKHNDGGQCLFGIYYIVYFIYLFWTPYWLIALFMMILGIVTNGLSQTFIKNYKIEMDRRDPDDSILEYNQRGAKVYWVIDKIFSSIFLVILLYLHSIELGFIA